MVKTALSPQRILREVDVDIDVDENIAFIEFRNENATF